MTHYESSSTLAAVSLKRNALLATTNELAQRWQIPRDRVPMIAYQLGLDECQISAHHRYSWRSVWAAEGSEQPRWDQWDQATRKVFLTPTDAALQLNVSLPTIHNRLWDRSIPCLRLGPRTCRIDPVVIEQIVDGSRHLFWKRPLDSRVRV